MSEVRELDNKIQEFVAQSIVDEKLSFNRFFKNREVASVLADTKNTIPKIDPSLNNLRFFLEWSVKYPHLPHKVLIEKLELEEWTSNLSGDLFMLKNEMSSK